MRWSFARRSRCGTQTGDRNPAGGRAIPGWRSARGSVLALAAVVALIVPGAALPRGGANGAQSAYVPQSLLQAAAANSNETFKVIVQGRIGVTSAAVGDDVQAENERDHADGARAKLKARFRAINGVATEVNGRTLLRLAGKPYVLSITPDAPLAATGYENAEMWRQTADVTSLWGTFLNPAPPSPAIAIVDSGIDATKAADFGARVVASVNLSSLAAGAIGDQEGHGTMVAGLAAGASPLHPGVAQTAPLVDVRTSDGDGRSLTSDVVAACDWILAHKNAYDIRVVNLSMAGDTQTSFRIDPIDKAIERLWFNGIVVVTAAGNHGVAGSAVDMSFAPGNDPFVISVGAADQLRTADTADDTIAPWSAYGHSVDGFAKPELSAPGRYMIAPVPTSASFPGLLPDRVVAPGYMWMSGTSFAAPIVAGAAAQILARHPGWTPDQVKGALMLTARYLPNAGWAAGVGEIDAAAATAVSAPPNPNENLNAFVVTDPATGAKSFDDTTWAAAVSTNANWSSANWGAANWASANWASANWASANWGAANWGSANWASANWASANWGAANWGAANWAAAVFPE
jgi:serine protease AprX